MDSIWYDTYRMGVCRLKELYRLAALLLCLSLCLCVAFQSMACREAEAPTVNPESLVGTYLSIETEGGYIVLQEDGGVSGRLGQAGNTSAIEFEGQWSVQDGKLLLCIGLPGSEEGACDFFTIEEDRIVNQVGEEWVRTEPQEEE